MRSWSALARSLLVLVLIGQMYVMGHPTEESLKANPYQSAISGVSEMCPDNPVINTLLSPLASVCRNPTANSGFVDRVAKLKRSIEEMDKTDYDEMSRKLEESKIPPSPPPADTKSSASQFAKEVDFIVNFYSTAIVNLMKNLGFVEDKPNHDKTFDELRNLGIPQSAVTFIDYAALKREIDLLMQIQTLTNKLTTCEVRRMLGPQKQIKN